MAVDVMLNALCYALGQAEDYIAVVYREAEYDEQQHFKQVVDLAKVVVERYEHFNDDTEYCKAVRANCHWWDERFEKLAKCKTLEEYKQL